MIHLKFSYSNVLIIGEKNIGNFPEKYDGNFRKISGKIWNFPDNFSASHHYGTTSHNNKYNSSEMTCICMYVLDSSWTGYDWLSVLSYQSVELRHVQCCRRHHLLLSTTWTAQVQHRDTLQDSVIVQISTADIPD